MFEITISDNQEKQAEEFRKNHKNCELDIRYKGVERLWRIITRKPLIKFGPYPNHFSYIIDPTGIGYGVSIKCNYCGETLDITDYDTW